MLFKRFRGVRVYKSYLPVFCMSIGLLFNQTWRTYRTNAAVSAKIMLIYYFIPLVVLISILLFLASLTGLLPAFNELSSSLLNVSNIDKPGAPADTVLVAQAQDAAQRLFIRAIPVFIGGILFGLAFFFVSFLGYAALIGGASRVPVMSYSNAVKAGKEIYWSLMGCVALLMLVVLALELALIIFVFLSAVIGSVFGSIGGVLFLLGSFAVGLLACFALLGRLIFAPYALVIERSGVMASFKKSWTITQGKTWAMMSLLLLLITLLIICMLILVLILFIIGLPFGLYGLDFESGMISERVLVLEALFQSVIQFVLALFITPFVVYFFKQVYFSWDKPRDTKGKRMFK